ncbi:hypothetical protein [Paenibacillus sp. RC67]|uniref:hypothetical protein n=1 Tax=Paenibacillus sp. RC67 TaxID=3039392 RepID=UPI0024AD6EB8|nr:hypothetical protein [Paenibacillus sp. RC67]
MIKKPRMKNTEKRRKDRKLAQSMAVQIKNVTNKVPVLMVLKDGTYYYGMVRGVEDQELIFQGIKGENAPSKRSAKTKAGISSFSGLGSLLGNSGRLGGLLGGGLGSFGGLGGNGTGGGGWGSLGGVMRFGFGMMKFIVPLMKGFGGLGTFFGKR